MNGSSCKLEYWPFEAKNKDVTMKFIVRETRTN